MLHLRWVNLLFFFPRSSVSLVAALLLYCRCVFFAVICFLPGRDASWLPLLMMGDSSLLIFLKNIVNKYYKNAPLADQSLQIWEIRPAFLLLTCPLIRLRSGFNVFVHWKYHIVVFKWRFEARGMFLSKLKTLVNVSGCSVKQSGLH